MPSSDSVQPRRVARRRPPPSVYPEPSQPPVKNKATVADPTEGTSTFYDLLDRESRNTEEVEDEEELKPEPEPEELEIESEPDPEPELEPESERELETEIETEHNSELEYETERDPGSEYETERGLESDPGSDSEPESGLQSEYSDQYQESEKGREAGSETSTVEDPVANEIMDVNAKVQRAEKAEKDIRKDMRYCYLRLTDLWSELLRAQVAVDSAQEALKTAERICDEKLESYEESLAEFEDFKVDMIKAKEDLVDSLEEQKEVINKYHYELIRMKNMPEGMKRRDSDGTSEISYDDSSE